jgi:2-dehydro-3-deoxygluconokinase
VSEVAPLSEAEATAASPPEVITLGECLVALVAGSHGPLAEVTTFERHVAGAEANVAVGLARLGHRPAFVGRVGADGFGTAIVRKLRGEGVMTEFLTAHPGAATGLLVRERRVLGPAEVNYYRAGAAGSRLQPSDVDAATDLFRSARWLHVTGITPALSVSARAAVERAVELARTSGLTVSLDLNLRRKLWSEEEAALVLSDLAARADVVLASIDEATVVTRSHPSLDAAALAQAIAGLGPSLVVLKLGSTGALGLERGRDPIRAPAIETPIVDTIGAGDGFAAGFIATRLEGGSLEAALRAGNACGAAAVAVVGDLTGLPERLELDRLLATVGAEDAIR